MEQKVWTAKEEEQPKVEVEKRDMWQIGTYDVVPFTTRRKMPDSDLKPKFPLVEVLGMLVIIPAGASFALWVLSNIFSP